MSNQISIIIPAYNCESTIKRCLESVINQTYKEIEILIIDDGSTDNTKSICKEYLKKDKRIKYIMQKNEGVSSARNTGLDLANGSLIQFLDSDDYIDLDFCECAINSIEENQSELVVLPVQVHKCGDVIRTVRLKRDIFYLDFENTYLDLRKINLAVWNKLYHKKYISNKFDISISLGEDTMFVLNYLSNIKKISYCDNSLYHVSLDNDNSLNRKIRTDKILLTLLVRNHEMQWYINRYGDNSDISFFCNLMMSTYVYGILGILKNDSKLYAMENAEIIERDYIDNLINSCSSFICLKYKIMYFFIKHRFFFSLKVISLIRGI